MPIGMAITIESGCLDSTAPVSGFEDTGFGGLVTHRATKLYTITDSLKKNFSKRPPSSASSPYMVYNSHVVKEETNYDSSWF